MELTTELLLRAYRSGVFPMGAPDGGVDWYSPDPRAVLPLDDRFHVPRSLRRVVERGAFAITSDVAFEDVIDGCAEPTPDRPSTWITPEIRAAFTELHHRGLAHSVECWSGGRLAGGLYGVALGGAFFGESMFSRERDASKVALVRLVEWLRAGGFRLLDVQFTTPHLERFGAYDVPRREYLRRLADALRVEARWEPV